MAKKKTVTQVEKYPFSDKKDLCTPTENEVRGMQWIIKDWSVGDPKWKAVEETLRRYGYYLREYKPMSFSEIVEVLNKNTFGFHIGAAKREADEIEAKSNGATEVLCGYS